MKKTVLLIFILFCITGSNAQVLIQPLPRKNYDVRIRKYLDELKVVDTHEHLLSQLKVIERKNLDFMLLLAHYSNSDIHSSGLPSSEFRVWMKDSLSISRKWEIIKPWWEKSFNTAYCRNALLASSKLFGVDVFNDTAILVLSERIQDAYKNENWFYEILDKSNIEFVIQDDYSDRSFRRDKFRYVVRFDHFINIRDKNSIEGLSKRHEMTIQTLDDLLSALDKSFEDSLREGIVGVKSGLAYNRILYYENVEREKAEEVFQTVMTKPGPHSFIEVKPLQDYIMHVVIQKAKANRSPVIFHTGLQTGSGNIIENSKPTHLVNLFQDYPDVRFVLYHGSYPYGGELATLAKNFRNVYIDLCWLYIISPSYAERYLHEWLETVPVNKIMGFGGDFFHIENTYAHLIIAKQIISNVLIEKVASGYLSENEAKKIAQMILYENAKNFYNL